MKQQLLQTLSVEESELQTLAHVRSRTIQTYLIQRAGVPAEALPIGTKGRTQFEGREGRNDPGVICAVIPCRQPRISVTVKIPAHELLKKAVAEDKAYGGAVVVFPRDGEFLVRSEGLQPIEESPKLLQHTGLITPSPNRKDGEAQ